MQRHKLTALGIKSATAGKLGDGAGLILVKTGDVGKWVYRYTHLGKRRDMGLGQWPTLSLAGARSARDRWQAVLAAGQDPMAAREAEREAARQERDKTEATFAELVALVFEARKAGLREGGTRGKWLSPLTTHIIPAIGKMKVSRLTRHDYVRALRPIWQAHHPTAQKALRRITIVIREGRFMEFDCDPFECEAAGRILGEVNHIPQRIPATAWQDLPHLFNRIEDSTAGDCLRLLILTVARSAACIGARKDEIEGDVWTIPAERMKGVQAAAHDFRIPLSNAALELTQRVSRLTPGPYLFPSSRGNPIRVNNLERVLNRMREPGRPHGMRSTFKMWVQDNEACSWDVSETVLAHRIGNAVSRAYARSDLLERRRIIMEAWAGHVTGRDSNIIRLKA